MEGLYVKLNLTQGQGESAKEVLGGVENWCREKSSLFVHRDRPREKPTSDIWDGSKGSRVLFQVRTGGSGTIGWFFSL